MSQVSFLHLLGTYYSKHLSQQIRLASKRRIFQMQSSLFCFLLHYIMTFPVLRFLSFLLYPPAFVQFIRWGGTRVWACLGRSGHLQSSRRSWARYAPKCKVGEGGSDRRSRVSCRRSFAVANRAPEFPNSSFRQCENRHRGTI